MNIQTDVTLDFAKAFGYYRIALAKLRTYGVSGHLLSWFTDHQMGRVQWIVVDGTAS